MILPDSDRRPREACPVVMLGGVDYDPPVVLSRHAGTSQINVAIRAVATGLSVRLPVAMDVSCGAMRETDDHAPQSCVLEVLATPAGGTAKQNYYAPID